MFSAKRVEVLCFINKENFSLPRISMKELQGKTLSVLWQETTRRTTVMCRCKFDSSNKKHMRDFLLSPRALRWDDVTQQQSQEYAGLHGHMTELVQETQQHREMFEESRAAHSAAGPEIDRPDRAKQNFNEKHDATIMAEQNTRQSVVLTRKEYVEQCTHC